MWPGSWGFVVTAATLQDNIRDKLHPIMLSMNYSLVEKPRTFQLGPLSLDTFPVLNQDQSHENETKVLGEHRRCWAGSPGEPSLGLDGGSWGHPCPSRSSSRRSVALTTSATATSSSRAASSLTRTSPCPGESSSFWIPIHLHHPLCHSRGHRLPLSPPQAMPKDGAGVSPSHWDGPPVC